MSAAAEAAAVAALERAVAEPPFAPGEVALADYLFELSLAAMRLSGTLRARESRGHAWKPPARPPGPDFVTKSQPRDD